jgi:hypothetical protein
VISGIASLLPKGNSESKKKGEEKRTNKEMNDEKQVEIVDDRVTDDWDVVKKSLEGQLFVPQHNPEI